MNRRYRRVPRRAGVPHDAPERQRAELRRHHHGSARRQGRERGRDEAVHVKERHDAQRHVARGQVVRAGHVTRRNRQVRVRQRHALRASGAAARMQDQGDVVRARRLVGLPPGPVDRHASVAIKIDRDDRHLARLRRAPRIVGTRRRQEQHLRARVFEKEAELFFPVRRIQRRGRARLRRGEKRHDGRQAVRQGHADAVAAADTLGGQCLGDASDLIAQVAVRDAQVLFRKDDGRLVGRAGGEQAEQRGRGHMNSQFPTPNWEFSLKGAHYIGKFGGPDVWSTNPGTVFRSNCCCTCACCLRTPSVPALAVQLFG